MLEGGSPQIPSVPRGFWQWIPCRRPMEGAVAGYGRGSSPSPVETRRRVALVGAGRARGASHHLLVPLLGTGVGARASAFASLNETARRRQGRGDATVHRRARRNTERFFLSRVYVKIRGLLADLVEVFGGVACVYARVGVGQCSCPDYACADAP